MGFGKGNYHLPKQWIVSVDQETTKNDQLKQLRMSLAIVVHTRNGAAPPTSFWITPPVCYLAGSTRWAL